MVKVCHFWPPFLTNSMRIQEFFFAHIINLDPYFDRKYIWDVKNDLMCLKSSSNTLYLTSFFALLEAWFGDPAYLLLVLLYPPTNRHWLRNIWMVPKNTIYPKMTSENLRTNLPLTKMGCQLGKLPPQKPASFAKKKSQYYTRKSRNWL